MDQNVGCGQQVLEGGSVGRHMQIEAGATLAQGHFRDHPGFVPVGWVKAQDIGTEPSQKAAGRGAGKHAGQVQHLDPGQGPGRRTAPVALPFKGVGSELHQRFGVHRTALRVGLPVLPGAHFGGAATGLDHRLFQLALVPLRHLGRHARALAGGPQYAFGGSAVMGGIGVQADPAIAGRVVAGNRVPQGRHAPADGAQGTGEPEGGQAPVDADDGPAPGLAVQQFAQGLAGGGQAGAGQVGHRERRGQGALAGLLQGHGGQAQRGLHGCQHSGHGRPSETERHCTPKRPWLSRIRV